MTADGTALLAAVLDAPADDAPRLVYADWLEENATADHVGPCPECGGKPRHKLVTRNGEEYRYEQIVCKCAWRRFAVPGNGFAERAEFIRVQCALARTAEVSVASTRLMARERELWSAPLVLRDLPDAGVCELPPLTIHPAEHGQLLSSCLVRRGFVAEVRAPMGVLVGGPCGRCVGSGIRGHEVEDASGDVDWTASPCPACSGSGRTPGVLAALCATQPVEKAAAVDVQTVEVANRWHLFRSGDRPFDPRSPWQIPGDLYDMIELHDDMYAFTTAGVTAKAWEDRDGYVAALSRALLAHGRHLAGRPATA
jgi:uncharacterized protein (TIGR02996 family)